MASQWRTVGNFQELALSFYHTGFPALLPRAVTCLAISLAPNSPFHMYIFLSAEDENIRTMSSQSMCQLWKFRLLRQG